MLRDTIHKLAHNAHSIQNRGFSGIYNDFPFSIKVMTLPKTETTNDNAVQRSELNKEANSMKVAAGLGLGQYKDPMMKPVSHVGTAVLGVRLGGKSYELPIEFNARGQYTSPVLKRPANSLQEIATRMMDGLFEYFSVPNDAKEYREQMQRRPQVASQDYGVRQAHAGKFGMN